LLFFVSLLLPYSIIHKSISNAVSVISIRRKASLSKLLIRSDSWCMVSLVACVIVLVVPYLIVLLDYIAKRNIGIGILILVSVIGSSSLYIFLICMID
jgi:hypothetical protein